MLHADARPPRWPRMLSRLARAGEITATFTIGNRVGVQKKTITVVTDDQQEPTMLNLTATIPRLLEVQPTFLFWSANDTIEPKQLR